MCRSDVLQRSVSALLAIYYAADILP